jgi:hypothetical protein
MQRHDVLILVVHGAYGHDYKTWEDCEKDWKDGKDFKILGGPYCSNRDVMSMIERRVRILMFINGEAEMLGKIFLTGEDKQQ